VSFAASDPTYPAGSLIVLNGWDDYFVFLKARFCLGKLALSVLVIKPIENLMDTDCREGELVVHPCVFAGSAYYGLTLSF